VNDCAAILRALSDQTRLTVVRRLLDDAPLHVTEIQSIVGVEQSLLSYHLRLLRDAGLVVARRHGRRVLYEVCPHIVRRWRGRSLNFGCCALTFS